MPPRKRTKAPNASAVLAAAAAFLATKNIEAPAVTQETLDALGDRDYRSNDAVLLFAHHPPGFIPGKCHNCGAIYAVNRKSVGFCSDPCRREDWRKTTGLEWSAISTHDVWEGNPPHIISPAQLKKLAALAEWFNTNQIDLDTLVEMESEPEPVELHGSNLLDELGFQVVLDSAIPQDQILIGNFDQLFGSEEEDHESSLQTNPPQRPSESRLSLTDEEASLFEF